MKLGLSFLWLCLFSAMVMAQVSPNSDLHKAILRQDSLLFQVGFNTCNVAQMEALLSERFVFVHDKDGISNRQAFVQAFKSGLCQNPSAYQARRELLPNSVRIYPLYNKGIVYGAIQEGIHQFYEKQLTKPEKFGSSAKFTHVWIKEDSSWKLSSSLSFDHLIRQLPYATGSYLENNEAVEKWIQENHIPILGLGIIDYGQLKTVKVYGHRSPSAPAPYNTIFNVASLTKPVTAMVALILASQKKWKLDEPLCHYWTDPDIADDPRNKKLTTRLVLSHQTGFPNWRYMDTNKKLRFQFDPGTGYQYSGEGLEYLRKALEQKFKKSLQVLAHELLFTPMKMEDTRYIWDAQIDTSRLALGYDEAGNPYEIVKNKTPNGADDLYTTIEDYGNFLVSVMQGQGLTKEIFQEMISPQVATSKGKQFGLGFEIYPLENGEYALSHGGSDEGTRTLFFLLPKTKQGLLIFTNSDSGTNVYEDLIKYYLGTQGQKILDIEMK